MPNKSIFASPNPVNDIEDCYFYHVMDVPGYGVLGGEWDLRGVENEYLGRIKFEGKRVLEIGAASGHLSFWMERQGAEVIACDLSPEHKWDIVPMRGRDFWVDHQNMRAGLKKLNNSFWLSHQAFESKVKMIYSSVYDLPEETGKVDIAIYSAVLIHLRDPFLALQKGLEHTLEKVVITEQLHLRYLPFILLSSLLEKARIHAPFAMFIPSPRREQYDSWWSLTPSLIRAFLRVLGFSKTRTYYHHKARYLGKRKWMFTIVGERVGGNNSKLG